MGHQSRFLWAWLNGHLPALLSSVFASMILSDRVLIFRPYTRIIHPWKVIQLHAPRNGEPVRPMSDHRDGPHNHLEAAVGTDNEGSIVRGERRNWTVVLIIDCAPRPRRWKTNIWPVRRASTVAWLRACCIEDRQSSTPTRLGTFNRVSGWPRALPMTRASRSMRPSSRVYSNRTGGSTASGHDRDGIFYEFDNAGWPHDYNSGSGQYQISPAPMR